MSGARGFAGLACFSAESDIGASAVAILTPIGNDIYCMTVAVDQTAARRGAGFAAAQLPVGRESRIHGAGRCDGFSLYIDALMPGHVAAERSLFSRRPLRLCVNRVRDLYKFSQHTHKAH